jgi:hypothetical protein
MELAGMVQLHWSPPIQLPDSASEEDLADFFDVHFQQVEVEVLQGDLGNESTFKARFEQARRLGGNAAAASLTTMRGVLSDARVCRNAIFARTYTLRLRNGDVLHVLRRCGGCPACRRVDLGPNRGADGGPEPYVSVAREQSVPARLEGLLTGKNACAIHYVGTSIPWSELDVILERLIDGGSRLLVAPLDGQEVIRRHAADARSGNCATEELSSWLHRDRPSSVPTVVVVPPDYDESAIHKLLRHQQNLATMVIIHELEQRGPSETKLLLRELVTPSMSIAAALGKI